MINYTRRRYETDFLYEGGHIVSDYAIERYKCLKIVALLPPKDIFREERKFLNASIDDNAYRIRCGLMVAGSWRGWKPTDMFT